MPAKANPKANIVAIVTASGVGSRMNAPLPKQYLTIQGKTILEYAIEPFLAHPDIRQVIVTVSPEDRYYSQLNVLNSPKICLVFGGETRAHSVFNGLNAIENIANDSTDETLWVLVHDGARPCLKRADLDKLLQHRQHQDGAILATRAIDTMKRADGSQIIHTEDRSTLWHALTPQFFPLPLLKQAMQSAFEQGQNLTDEASAMELAGFKPQLVEGRSDNIKVTRPEDLALAEFYLTQP